MVAASSRMAKIFCCHSLLKTLGTVSRSTTFSTSTGAALGLQGRNHTIQLQHIFFGVIGNLIRRHLRKVIDSAVLFVSSGSFTTVCGVVRPYDIRLPQKPSFQHHSHTSNDHVLATNTQQRATFILADLPVDSASVQAILTLNVCSACSFTLIA